MRRLLPLLLLGITSQLYGQQDMVYHRGITVSISYDVEREKEGPHVRYTPEDGRDFSHPLRPPFVTRLINGNDTLFYPGTTNHRLLAGCGWGTT